VQFAERTKDGLLRHASFQGLREDSARPEHFDVRTVPDRLDALKQDPWATFDDARGSIAALVGRSRRKNR